MILLNTLTQTNIGRVASRPNTENSISHSLLTQIDVGVAMRGFSIKYVANGVERYHLNQKHFEVRPGRYLLAQPEHIGRVQVESKVTVEGLCINLSPRLMAEVIAVQQHPEAIIDAPLRSSMADLHQLWQSPFHGDNPLLLEHLTRLHKAVSTFDPADIPTFRQDFFYQAAELFVRGYGELEQQLLACKAVKMATRVELLRRVTQGREVIESGFTQAMDMASVARQAQLSEYHFYRLFKAIYGCSPYQLMLNRRMEMGERMLKSGHFTVSEIALKCGFADIFSFSKAFKKHYGISPSKFHY
jgi:AraC family transcriptional regulator